MFAMLPRSKWFARAALVPLVFWGIPTARAQDDTQQLTAAYNAAGIDIFRQLELAPGNTGNIALSPYSIGTAMAMALSGARGETAAELAKVLKHQLDHTHIEAANAKVMAILNGYDKSAAQPSCAEGLQWTGERCEAPAPANSHPCPPQMRSDGNGGCAAIPAPPPSARLLTANALMLTSGLIAKDYTALIKDKYAAEVFQGADLDTINDWVKRKTEGKIDKILDRLDPTTAAVLINAIYFKARWLSTFDKQLTEDGPFNLAPSQKVSVPMMHQRSDYNVVARQGYRAIRLPYDVEALGMIIILPNKVDGLGEISRAIDAKALSELRAALHGETSKLVELSMPRFKAPYEASLKTPFQQLGMVLAFDPGKADFGGLTGHPASDAQFAVDDIRHRTVIEVTEEGTEAAAATAIGIYPASAPPKSEPFDIDRPFLFYVIDDATGAVLFEGRIVDPR